jgi:hypothetical protein
MTEQPIIRGGVFIAPVVAPSWEPDSTGFAATPDPAAPPNFSKPVFASQDYPLAAYWRNIEAIAPLLPPRVKEEGEEAERDDDGDVVIDDAFDNHGVHLPSVPAGVEGPFGPAAKTENVKDLFARVCKNDVEREFSPMGIVNGDGTMFKLVLPPGEFGKRFADKLIDCSMVVKTATSRHGWEAQQIVAASMILPCPMHVSPLLLTLIRDGNGSSRFTDAITNATRLHLLRVIIRDIDTENPEHKVCRVCVGVTSFVLNKNNNRQDATSCARCWKSL